MNFSKAESLLYEKLQVNRNDISDETITVSVKPGKGLEKIMTLYAYDLQARDYRPEKHLSITVKQTYDIGETGGVFVDFELTKAGVNSTKITVDYTNRWYGFFPPFVFYNPGLWTEDRIHKLIWNEMGSSKS